MGRPDRPARRLGAASGDPTHASGPWATTCRHRAALCRAVPRRAVPIRVTLPVPDPSSKVPADCVPGPAFLGSADGGWTTSRHPRPPLTDQDPPFRAAPALASGHEAQTVPGRGPERVRGCEGCGGRCQRCPSRAGQGHRGLRPASSRLEEGILRHLTGRVTGVRPAPTVPSHTWPLAEPKDHRAIRCLMAPTG